MQHIIIYNPNAGKGKALKLLKGVCELMVQNHHLFTAMESPIHELPAPDWRAFDSCLIIGGDGTLHRILNKWGVPPLPCMLLGGGSGNDFMLDLYPKLTIEQVLPTLLKNRIKEVDLGICNGILFATGVGIGFDGFVAKRLQQKGWLSGHAAYYAAVLGEIFFYHEKPLAYHIDGKEGELPCFMLTVGNTRRFGGGFMVTPGATPFDGQFQICLIKAVTRWQRIINLSKLKKGKHLHLRFVEALEAKKIEVKAAEFLPCHMDGECYDFENFTISMASQQLKLII